MARLLYISSLGHSGSTILDLLCGNLASVGSLGEAHFLSWQLLQGRVLDDPQSFCSCGKYFDECAVWSVVLRTLSERSGVDIVSRPKGYNLSVNRSIVRGSSNIHHRMLNAAVFLSNQTNYVRLGRRLCDLYRPGALRTWEMFDEIGSVLRTNWVVDSSKSLYRFLYLRKIRPQDTRLIVLVRGAEGYCSSSHHGLSDSLIAKRIKFWKKYHSWHLPAILKDLRHEEILFVKYESLCKDPLGCLTQVSRFLDLPGEPTEEQTILVPYKKHTVQGNPIRLLKDPMKIRYDERWRVRLNPDQIYAAQAASSEVFSQMASLGFDFI